MYSFLESDSRLLASFSGLPSLSLGTSLKAVCHLFPGFELLTDSGPSRCAGFNDIVAATYLARPRFWSVEFLAFLSLIMSNQNDVRVGVEALWGLPPSCLPRAQNRFKRDLKNKSPISSVFRNPV
ncbi:hypothetical protein Y032_0011g1264 [Ancylostoma ceylanicum]|uniref:Uncharacterized protein n=1 Tax=Ancylostoma ceylanicum TaxID=53326 RepID=A0A016VFP7_9BILA|nr:hypothetical protein Y032_0011g1264 [Ancylostoma ceylanicum]